MLGRDLRTDPVARVWRVFMDFVRVYRVCSKRVEGFSVLTVVCTPSRFGGLCFVRPAIAAPREWLALVGRACWWCMCVCVSAVCVRKIRGRMYKGSSHILTQPITAEVSRD